MDLVGIVTVSAMLVCAGISFATAIMLCHLKRRARNVSVPYAKWVRDGQVVVATGHSGQFEKAFEQAASDLLKDIPS